MSKLFDFKLKNGTSLPFLNHSKFDDAAFERFFKENFSEVCAYCQFKFGFDIDEAKEAAHSGFIKLWENRDSLSTTLPVKAYLYKTVTNISFDILRHQKVKQKHEKHVQATSTFNYSKFNFDNAEFKELKTCVDRAISELPGQMRTIFEMSRYDGLKYSDIACRLEISVKTVETQMSRALVKLRQKLAEYLPIILFLILLVTLA